MTFLLKSNKNNEIMVVRGGGVGEDPKNFETLVISSKDACRVGEGGSSPTRETEKIVAEKSCYFPELYKMTKVREDGIEKGEKVNFPLRFVYVKFKVFSTNFKPHWF